jgi:xanthine dehydrogenase accessory factor
MEIWEFVESNLEKDLNVALLVIIDSMGSSPGQPGFKMAVSADGRIHGSIGGGNTEYTLVEKARKAIRDEVTKPFLTHHIHRDDAASKRSGLICSGEHWVACYPLRKEHLDLIRQIAQAAGTGEKGMLTCSQDGIAFFPNKSEHHKHKAPVTSEGEWELSVPTDKKNHIYVFGAGHVGLALSKVMRELDFTIHIFDDRREISTLRDNQAAHTNQVVNYKNIGHLVPDGDNIYAVIMTFGHQSDEVVLRQLLKKNIKYLGMMGSDKKVKKIFENQRMEGVPETYLKKVDAPIGLSIGSQTPAEIAISIAAKIVEVKND